MLECPASLYKTKESGDWMKNLYKKTKALERTSWKSLEETTHIWARQILLENSFLYFVEPLEHAQRQGKSTIQELRLNACWRRQKKLHGPGFQLRGGEIERGRNARKMAANWRFPTGAGNGSSPPAELKSRPIRAFRADLCQFSSTGPRLSRASHRVFFPRASHRWSSQGNAYAESKIHRSLCKRKEENVEGKAKDKTTKKGNQ